MWSSKVPFEVLTKPMLFDLPNSDHTGTDIKFVNLSVLIIIMHFSFASSGT